MKSNFFKLLCLLLSILYAHSSAAQDTIPQAQNSIPKNHFTLMVRQPLTWITKPTIYLGYKTKQLTLFLSASYFNSSLCIGPQVALELQTFHKSKPKSQRFYYGRLAIGQYGPGKNYDLESYYSFGSGFGWNIFLDKEKNYFFQPTIGLNVGILSGNRSFSYEGDFYLGGPGTPIDLKLRFGYVFN